MEEAYSRACFMTVLGVVMSVSFCLRHHVPLSTSIIRSGLCACTDVLYVSFWSNVRPRTLWCFAMGNAVLFILRSRLLLYAAGSGVNRVHSCLCM